PRVRASASSGAARHRAPQFSELHGGAAPAGSRQTGGAHNSGARSQRSAEAGARRRSRAVEQGHERGRHSTRRRHRSRRAETVGFGGRTAMTWRVAASIAALATLFAAGRPAAMAPSDAAAISVDHGVEDPAVSPDGRRIAVSVLGKIFTMAASGGDAAMVDDGIGWDTHP